MKYFLMMIEWSILLQEEIQIPSQEFTLANIYSSDINILLTDILFIEAFILGWMVWYVQKNPG